MATTSPPASNDASVAVYALPLDDDDAPVTLNNEEYDAQRDRALLRQNASWFCRLRWTVVSVLTLAGVAAFFPDWVLQFGLQLQPSWLLTTAVMLAIANCAYLALLRRLPANAAAGRLRALLCGQIVFDLLVLTAVIHFLGSQVTYAPFAYLFHIILACIFFHRWESLVVTVVSAGLYVGLVLLELAGVLQQQSAVTGASALLAASVEHGIWNWQLCFLLAIWTIIWYLASRLADELRDRERQLAAINLRLEASSAERARHMLQTTHQLKAPFAAIHANTQLLLGGYSGTLTEPSKRLIERIASRSRMLSQQIQQMLQLANLRSQSQGKQTATLIDLHELIRASIERFEPTAAMRGIRIESQLEPIQVWGIEDYLKMLVDNLLSNAVSYSYNEGKVEITCHRRDETMAGVTIRDYGIGIPADKLPHVFQDYYRTTEATQHNKASSGLGLAVVRLVASALRISVRLESAPGWGSRFSLKIPAIPDAPIS